MKAGILLCLLFGLACCTEGALAMPKAAENEDAQVSRGADLARPKMSAKPAKSKAGGRTSAAAKGKRVGSAPPPHRAKAQHGGVGIAPLALC